MIQGIFYARFFPQEGTKIYAQSPPGCIVPVPGVDKPCLFDFGILQEYIIPRKAFYNRYMTVDDPDGRYTVLGFPVSIPSPEYDRNEFIFNFGLVVESDVDQLPYERVVRRLAATFAEMEKQGGYLSRDSSAPPPAAGDSVASLGDGDGDGDRATATTTATTTPAAAAGDDAARLWRRPIESLLEIVKEDLNNYGECMIPVDDANTINMKLFPHHPTPAEVRGWHVPVAKMRFADVVDPTWDLTMQRVVAHIDGVSDVRRIAFAADVSLDLARQALRHLLYYDTILLLDMFFFGSCYAPRPGVHDFVANAGGIVDECANYVCIGPGSMQAGGGGGGGGGREGVEGGGGGGGNAGGGGSGGNDGEREGDGSSGQSGRQEQQQRISNYVLIKLMTTFCVGKSVMEWLKGHMDAGLDVLRYVDVRRLVQFGVIKGCLYRVHKYVVSKQHLAALATGQARPGAVGTGAGDPLQKYTDGCHSFDQIVTELNTTDAAIMEKLKRFPAPDKDLAVLYR